MCAGRGLSKSHVQVQVGYEMEFRLFCYVRFSWGRVRRRAFRDVDAFQQSGEQICCIFIAAFSSLPVVSKTIVSASSTPHPTRCEPWYLCKYKVVRWSEICTKWWIFSHICWEKNVSASFFSAADNNFVFQNTRVAFIHLYFLDCMMLQKSPHFWWRPTVVSWAEKFQDEKKRADEELIQGNLTFALEGYDEDDNLKLLLDFVQVQYQCCGAAGQLLQCDFQKKNC